MTPRTIPKTTARSGLDLVRRQRPAPGPGHQHVDVAVEVAVDRVRAAGGERPADHRPERRAAAPVRRSRIAGHVARREDHRRHRRDQQQLDDPGLGQRDVGADRVAARRAAPVAVASSPAGRRRRPPGLVATRATRAVVVAGDGEAGQQRPDDRAEREVERLRPLVEPGQDLEPADQRPGPGTGSPTADGQPDERRVVALGPPGDDRGRRPRSARRRPPTQRWSTCAAAVDGRSSGRDERAVHQRPVGEHERRRPSP